MPTEQTGTPGFALETLARNATSVDAKARAAGIVGGAAAGLGAAGLMTALAPNPFVARYAPYVVGPAVGALAAAALTRAARSGLSKTALDDKEKRDALLIGGITGAGASSALINDAWSEGQLTGRRTLLHGTAEKNVPGIFENGLKATTDENAVNTSTLKERAEALERAGKLDEAAAARKIYEDSRNKVYLTRSRPQALGYAAIGELGGVDAYRKASLGAKAKAWLKALTGKGVVKFNVPVDVYEQVANPETSEGFKKYLENFRKAHKDSGFGAAYDYNGLRNRAVVLNADMVAPEYAVGSSRYQANTLREIGEYIRKHPKTFAKGLAKAGLGTAGLGASGYLAYRALSDRPIEE